jgi:hypothetical protein
MILSMQDEVVLLRPEVLLVITLITVFVAASSIAGKSAVYSLAPGDAELKTDARRVDTFPQALGVTGIGIRRTQALFSRAPSHTRCRDGFPRRSMMSTASFASPKT